MTDIQEQNNALCPTPHKKRYATKEAAREIATRTQIGSGYQLVPYDNCPCGWIHLTKEREFGPAYTEDQLLDMDQAQFNAVVRMDITGQGHPDTFKSLRSFMILSRWGDALKVFLTDLDAQLIERAGDQSPDTREWRGRIARVQVIVAGRQAELQHMRRQAGSRPRAEEEARSTQVQGILLSKHELRTVAGERALDRLKETYRVEFLAYLKEEYAALGIEPGTNLSRSMRSAGVLNTEPEEKS